MKNKLLLAVSLLSIFLVGFISLTAPAEANHAGCSSQAIVATMPGSLSSSDCRSHNRGSSYYADYYSFDALQGDKVTIDMMAGFDTYLYLMDANSNFLTSDDDGGEGNNSRIFEYQIPSTGTYTIDATSYGSGVAGDYTILIAGNSIPGGTGTPALLNGLKGTYIDGVGNIVGNQVDPDINFCSGSGCPSARAWSFGFSGNTDDFTVHWTGFVIPKFTESYTFYTSRDDDTTVAIGGVPVIVPGCGSGCNETRNVGNVAIPLTAGVPYSIDIVYQQTACCVARAILSWSSPSQPKSVIGSDSLRTVLPPAGSFPSISSFYLTAGSNPILPNISGGSSDPYSGSTPPGTTKTQTVWANYVGTSPTPPIRFSAVSVPAGVNVTLNPDNCTPGILWSPENPLSTPNNTCSVQMNMAVPADAVIDDKYTITVTAQRGIVPEATMVYVLEVAPTFVSCEQSHCAKFISQDVPTSMTPGSTQEVKIIMQNTGTAIWTSAGLGKFRLGSQNPQDNTTWGTGRVEMPLPAVLPGDTATFKFNVTAPSTPGTYNFQWRMVNDSCCWFGDFTPNLAINVAGTSAIPFSYQLTTTVSGNEDHTLDPGESFSEAVKVSILSGIPNLINLTYEVVSTNLGGVAPTGVSVTLNPTSCNVASGTGVIRDCSTLTVQTSTSTQPGSYVVNVKGQSQNLEGVSVLPFYFTVSSPTLIGQLEKAIADITKIITDILAGTYIPDLLYPVDPFYLTDFDNNYNIEGTGSFSKKIIVNLGFGGYLQGFPPKVTLSSGGTTPVSGITATFTYPDPNPAPDTDVSCDYYPIEGYTLQGGTGVTGFECLSNAVINIPANTPAGQYVLTINGVGEATVAVVGGTPIADPSSRNSMFYVINVGTNPCPSGTTGPGVPNCTPDECPQGQVGTVGACVVPPSVFTHVLTDPNNTYAVNMSAGTTNTSGQIKVTSTAGTIGASFKEVSFTTTAITKVGALTATGLTASAEPCSVSGGSPTCLSTITITAPSNATGQYIVTFTSSAENALVPGTISYTVTVNPIQPCPSGTTGTFPNCNVPCPAGTTGTNVPNCAVPCPAGTTGGTFPNCAPQPITCPPGTVGVVPNCTVPCPSGTTGTNLPNCVVPCPAGSTGTSVPNCTIVPPPSSFSISLNPSAATVSKSEYVGLGSAGSTSVSSNPSLVSQVNITGSPVIVLYEDPTISRADGQSVGGPTKIFARVNPGGCTQEGQVIVDPRAQGCLSVFLVNPDASASGVTYYIDVKAVNEQQRPATARFTLTVKP